MAGKPPAAPRAAQQSPSNASAGDSRAAAASDWGAPAARSGVRLEVKLAVLLIVTLSGAFGYLVHRKFDALRQQAAAAEGDQPETFVPLPQAPQVAGEIDLGAPPTQAAPDEPPFNPAATPAVAHASATTPAAAASPPPLLNWVSASRQSEPESLTGPDRQKLPMGGDPPRELPLQSEPPFLGDSADSELRGLFGGREGEASGLRGVAEPTPPTERASTTAADRAGSSSVEPGPVSEEPLAFPDSLPAATASSVPTATAVQVPATSSPRSPFPTEGPAAPPSTSEASDPVSSGTPRQEPRDGAAESAPLPPLQRDEPFEPSFDPAPFEPAERPSIAPAESAPAFPAATTPPGPGGESPSLSAEPTPPRMANDPQPRPVEGTTPDGDPFQLFSPATPPRKAIEAPAENVAASPPESFPQSPPTFSPEAVAGPFPPSSLPGATAPAPSLLEQPQLTPEPRPLDSAAAPERHRLLDEISTSPRPVAAPDPFPEVRPQPVPGGTFDPPPFAESSPRREGTMSGGTSEAAGGVRRPAGGDVPGTGVPTPERFYTVRPGDSYWTISRIQYGSGRYHAALLEHNRERLPEAERLHPGMQLQVPPVALLESRYPGLIPGAAASAGSSLATSPGADDEAGRFFISADGRPMYRVGKGDTLTSIAQRHLGRASRWEQIARMNQDVLSSPDRLQPGVVLRLPQDASQVAASPLP